MTKPIAGVSPSLPAKSLPAKVSNAELHAPRGKQGTVSLIGFILVLFFGILVTTDPLIPSVALLTKWQHFGPYRAITGTLVFSYIGYQWYLSFLRWQRRNDEARRHYTFHRIAGFAAPLLFYLHSVHLGHAYLAWLSLAFFVNNALGFANPQSMRMGGALYAKIWLITHIALSVIVVLLAFCHIYFAALYT